MECLGESDLSYGKCKMRNHFPISEDNIYGVIPIVGFAASCFTAGILMELLGDSLRSMTWSGVWFFIGFFIFALLELSYGFHAKLQGLLLLWITFKVVEIVATIGAVASIYAGPHRSGMAASAIINLIILLILIYLGYRKYKQLKTNNEDVSDIYPPLESKMNI